MRRREFITLLGGAAATWTSAARAQQPDRMRRIGAMMPFAEGDEEGRRRRNAFESGLEEFGWTTGKISTLNIAGSGVIVAASATPPSILSR